MAKTTLSAVSSVFDLVDRGSGETNIQDILSEATSKLSKVEMNRLDEIITELTQRLLKRVRERAGAKS